MEYDKYIREDGKVAILYSPGFGAGWYSWNEGCKGLLFDKDIVEAVLDGNFAKAESVAKSKYPEAYVGGAKKLAIHWLNSGDTFKIREFDGFERVDLDNDDNIVA
jgi:hypothetical protein